MSKSSTVTVREKPVEEVASAVTGGLTIHGETLVISTDQRIELVDLTKQVMEFVRKFKVREGLPKRVSERLRGIIPSPPPGKVECLKGGMDRLAQVKRNRGSLFDACHPLEVKHQRA